MGIFGKLFGKKSVGVPKRRDKKSAMSKPIVESTKNKLERKRTVKPNIEKLKEKEDVEGLIKALEYRKESIKDDHVLIRSCAAEALGKIGDERAVEPLIKALQDKAWDVTYTAIEALGDIGDLGAIEPIKKYVIETDVERVRGRGMIVLDEVFSLSKTQLKEVFLKSKASMDAKKILKKKRVKKKKKEVKGVKFVRMKYRDDDSFGVRYTYEVYTAENKKQAWEFIKTKSVNKKHYYIEVNVGDVNDPEVIVGLDIQGTYEA